MTAYTAKPSSRMGYRLESPLKLFRGVLTVAAAMLLVFTGLSGANAGSAPVELERVVVTQGDTIWGLAEQFSGDADIDAWIKQQSMDGIGPQE